MNTKPLTAIGVVAALGLASCTTDSGIKKEQETAKQQLDQFTTGQPVPLFSHSQLRQNLIDIETAQAEATVTTSFFFNMGINEPIHVCPSVGFPIPGTYQLTNPMQVAKVKDKRYVIPQLEANGVYTGDTTGTTVICIDDQGRGYAYWWEGFVSTVAGPAEFVDGRIVMTGEPTAEFSTGE